jgi:hypothetical protein
MTLCCGWLFADVSENLAGSIFKVKANQRTINTVSSPKKNNVSASVIENGMFQKRVDI